MSFILNESFRVAAPVDRVWAFLKDPAQVVACLPGAELTDTINALTYAGRVMVKVGPVSTAYVGQAQLTSVDDSARQMQLIGEGTESGGAGSARMAMTGTVAAVDGGSEVTVTATIDIAGKVMQFGRGMVESVSRQLFRQFTESARARLEEAESALARPAQHGASANGADAIRSRPSPTALRLLPLLWRAMLDLLRRLFRRPV